MIESILDYTEKNGLVYCQNYQGVKNNTERLYISDVIELNAHAVLFRRYFENDEDVKPYHSEPAVCIFKEEDIPFNSNEHLKLHAALWSEGKNEIYIIYGKTRVEIINARRPAEGTSNGNKPILNLENLKLASGAIKELNKERFSAYLFGSGTFWEQSEFENQLNQNNSPHIHLLDYLMAVRKKFISHNEFKLDTSTIDKLLVVSILVKFLEEIKDPGENSHILREIYKKKSVSSFVEAVSNGSILSIFEDLAAEFNGKIFDKFRKDEKEAIQQTNLELLAQFLQANIDIDTKQLFFWEQYSFKHLPAEVISSIYENFIQAQAERERGAKEKGVVYTPIHLVNFLVNEAMPLDKAEELFSDEKFKVLDPACGSGVFLVAVYKRLLQWWAINNSTADNVTYPDSNVAQKILENNIFGVDVKETATLVSIFSLTTALLDKLTPKEIWSNLKLRDLSKKNIQQSNFFKWAGNSKKKNKKFDLVIGNPPFNPEADVDKDKVLAKNLLVELDFKHTDIPWSSFALHFFEGSMALADKVCMIIPSSILLYNNSNTAQDYRKSIFTDFTISDIYDFTHLRRNLFHKSADTPVLALIAESKPSNRQKINHTVIKRMVTSEKKIRFEIDYYDQHQVPWRWAVDPSKRFIWKTNLIGGGRLFQLINRLSMLPSLKNYIKTKESWKEVRGFEGGNKIKLENKDRIISINENGHPKIKRNIDIQTSNLKDEYMYKPPFLIIEQVLGNDSLSSCFVPKNNKFTKKTHLYYNRNFIGISVPPKDEKLLEQLNKLIQNTGQDAKLNYQLFVLAISSNCLVQHETAIRKGDVMSIPYAEKTEYLDLSESEKILQEDVLNYYIHLGKAINKGSSGYKLNKKVSAEQLSEYGHVLCDTLNTIYSNENKSWQLGKTFQTDAFSICQIGFGKNTSLQQKHLTDLDKATKDLIDNRFSNSGSIYKKIIRINEHQNGFDCFYFIKPHSLRYWLKSIALRDADEIFGDLKKEGF